MRNRISLSTCHGERGTIWYVMNGDSILRSFASWNRETYMQARCCVTRMNAALEGNRSTLEASEREWSRGGAR